MQLSSHDSFHKKGCLSGLNRSFPCLGSKQAFSHRQISTTTEFGRFFLRFSMNKSLKAPSKKVKHKLKQKAGFWMDFVFCL